MAELGTDHGDVALTLDYPDAEVVFGIVCAVGTFYDPVLSYLKDSIKTFGYRPKEIHISNAFLELAESLDLVLDLPSEPEFERISCCMDAGNRVRECTERNDFLALVAASQIHSTRSGAGKAEPEAHKRTAHILVSLKRPEEVETLRKIYGPGFFLIGIFASEAERLKYLAKQKDMREAANRLVARDEKENEPFGQRTRDTFELADVFISVHREQYKKGLDRFLSLVFCNPYQTPTREEYAMFQAYSASLRSGALARQVGAAVVNKDGEVIGLGCNDVPRAGGGLCWEEDSDDSRDIRKGYDSNDRRKSEILSDTIERIHRGAASGIDSEAFHRQAREALRGGQIMEITEFGRDVHAEMDAMLSCSRVGVSLRDATLFVTTFPCHNCAKHLIAAGVRRVVYIEPYPKSRAAELYPDALRVVWDETGAASSDRRIPFEPFVGIGPRRFFDLFSLKLSSGYAVERKQGGEMISWDPKRDAKPRVPMQPTSYIQREQLVVNKLQAVYRKVEAEKHER